MRDHPAFSTTVTIPTSSGFAQTCFVTQQMHRLVQLRILVTLVNLVLVPMWKNRSGFKYTYGLFWCIFLLLQLLAMVSDLLLQCSDSTFPARTVCMKGNEFTLPPSPNFSSFHLLHVYWYPVSLIFLLVSFKGGTWLWIYIRQVVKSNFVFQIAPQKVLM